MRFFVDISYDGTLYNGWQRQTNTSNTVQEVLESALENIFKKRFSVSGCGRTDKGVHANQFYFSLDVDNYLDFNFIERLNYNLPDDIVANSIHEVDLKANTRFDALSRTYHYYFHFNSSPFLDKYALGLSNVDLNLEKICVALRLLMGKHDFKNFCRQPDKHNTTVCEMMEAGIYKLEKRDFYCIKFKANRFLRGMIRILVSQLLDIGKGEVGLEIIEDKLKSEPILLKQFSAYPGGLHLHNIEYKYLDKRNPITFFGIDDNWIKL